MRQIRASSPGAPPFINPATDTTTATAAGFTTLPRESLTSTLSQQLYLQDDGFSVGLPLEGGAVVIAATGDSASSTGRGILIGILSAFGSAIIAVLILTIFFFFRYTQRGRIMLDRLGRPGEYDDEQAFAQEEAAALETMDDISRAEYLRAKGKCISCFWFFFFFFFFFYCYSG